MRTTVLRYIHGVSSGDAWGAVTKSVGDHPRSLINSLVKDRVWDRANSAVWSATYEQMKAQGKGGYEKSSIRRKF